MHALGEGECQALLRAFTPDPPPSRRAPPEPQARDHLRAMLEFGWTPHAISEALARRGRHLSPGVLLGVRDNRPGQYPEGLLGALRLLPTERVTPQLREVAAHLDTLRSAGPLDEVLAGHPARYGPWLSGLFRLSVHSLGADRLRDILAGGLPAGLLTAQLPALRCCARLVRPDVFVQRLAGFCLCAYQFVLWEGHRRDEQLPARFLLEQLSLPPEGYARAPQALRELITCGAGPAVTPAATPRPAGVRRALLVGGDHLCAQKIARLEELSGCVVRYVALPKHASHATRAVGAVAGADALALMTRWLSHSACEALWSAAQAHQVPVLSVPYVNVDRIAQTLRGQFASRDVA